MRASSILYGILSLYMDPPIIHFNRIFHYKPSILGFSPYFWKHPYEYTIHLYNIHGIFMHWEKNFPYIFPVTSNNFGSFKVVTVSCHHLLTKPWDKPWCLWPKALIGAQKNLGFCCFFLKCSSLQFFLGGACFRLFSLSKEPLNVIFDSG